MEGRNEWRRVFRDSLPVMAGYLVLGAGFGILLRLRGYGLGWALGMSVFIYAGSMQFAGVGLMTSGAGILTTALTTLFVNARHLFYGISMLDRYRDAGRRKPYLIFALTDETYSLVCSGEERSLSYCFRLSLLNHLYWITGSALGSLAGAVLPFNFEGIDFSLTALFVTVFLGQWVSDEDHFPALVGAGASVAALLLFGPDRFLLPAMAGISAALLLRDRAERSRT